MIDLLVELFGGLAADKFRETSGPVSPVPRTLAGKGGDAERIKALEREHERLKLVTMALFEVLRDRHGVSEEELRQKIREIDLRDNRLDGKLTPARKVVKCEACSRTMLGSAMACPYCGQERTGGSPLY